MARQHGFVGSWFGSHQRISGRLGELGRRIGLVARRRWSLGFVEALSRRLPRREEAQVTPYRYPAFELGGGIAVGTVVWRAAF